MTQVGTQPENICLGCMSENPSGGQCQSCGWNGPLQPQSPIALAPGTVLHDQYLVGELLGCGGFGLTYIGRDLNLGMKVAIKEFFPRDLVTREPTSRRVVVYGGESHDFFAYGLERFLDEARTLASFDDYPGVVSIVNYFKENDTGYLVMKYLAGQTFKSYLESQGGRIGFETAHMIMTPVLDTLREVHQRGLLHRDISPDNIYITVSNQVKLIDFGAARCALGEKSRSLSVILKAGYAPREQYSSRGTQGPWTDIYAAGATLYRAITGQVPPDAPSRTEHDDLVPPSRRGVQIPPAAETALLKSLALKSSDRFQEVASFQTALGLYLISDPFNVQELRNRCKACGSTNVAHAKHCAICGAQLALARNERQVIPQPGALKYAGFDRRIAAWFIDSLIVGCAWLFAFLALLVLFAIAGTDSSDATLAALTLSILFMSPVGWLYYSILESSRRQGTIGKVLMRISVTDLTGARVSFWRATGRYFAKIISAAIAGVGFLMPAFSEKKQALHDSIAGCLLLDTR